MLFYFILEYCNTANIILSTISVTTSFLAVYFTFRRSPYFALAYAANDIVLIILWILVSLNDIKYLFEVYYPVEWKIKEILQKVDTVEFLFLRLVGGFLIQFYVFYDCNEVLIYENEVVDQRTNSSCKL